MNFIASQYWYDPHWCEANQRYLFATLAGVRADLKRYVDNLENKLSEDDRQQPLNEIAAAMPAPPAIDRLTAIFGLSNFERNLLLLCAGVEMDASFAPLCVAAAGDSRHTYATFSLALAALPNPHWDAVTPIAPLRRWRLIQVDTGSTLTLSPLRIDERILHYLAGTQHLDEQLVGIVEPLSRSEELVASHQIIAEKVAAMWSRKTVLPVVQLCGAESTSKQAIAAWACDSINLGLHRIAADVVPLVASELATLVQLWNRESILSTLR